MTRPLLQRLLRDERGTLTMEFLLWLPLLAFWLVVSAAFFQAYTARNDASNTAHALSDIVSRQVEVGEGFFADLYALQGQLLPRAAAGTRLRVSSIVYMEEDDTYRVLWSRAVGGGEALPETVIDAAFLPAMADHDTVLLTELDVPFLPFTDWAGIGARTWSFDLVARPRFVPAVALLGEGDDIALNDSDEDRRDPSERPRNDPAAEQ